MYTILNFNKIDFENIVFGQLKNTNNLKHIDIRYKTKNGKQPFLFKTSELTLLSKLKYNNLREYYIETLVNDSLFYNFILKLEEYVRNKITHKSKKIFGEEQTKELIDDCFKTCVKLSSEYTNPIVYFNFVKNKKYNTIIFNKNKIKIDSDSLEIDSHIILLIRFNRILFSTHHTEIEFIIDQIKISNEQNDTKLIQDYNLSNSL